ncbi:helix-turn-helix domain-containing protein [Nocardia sp. NBC_00508]|uniref:helix-turn-helix domain-containing protein n=1 Tax=Nocardia sp. NBC_00508 TaxID=2975992 RepID=UPI002E815B76|nr:helix-turn-helix domain-containing protein [Nocardia sp. NBC_00508]WUD64035.1 helix-turn-helix domain-containing protein [Nocardia sp. NBC_00508]
MVCRAVDLIAAGALDEATEAELAARLAVSERHLRRMFRTQVGATPDQLARSRRAHFARRLLDETELSVIEIAFASGFGSLRQFNRVMVATFRATPHELRQRRRRADRLVADGGLALRVPLPEPVQLDRRLAQLACGAIRGIENATTEHYRRTVSMDGAPGLIEISSEASDEVRLVAHLPRIEGLMHLVDQVQRLLVGGTWDPYEAAVQAIVTDNVGASEAPAVLAEIVTRYGIPIAGLRQFGLTHLFPIPAALAVADFHGMSVDEKCTRTIRDYSLDPDPNRLFRSVS